MSARKPAKPKPDLLDSVDEWVRFSYNGPTTKFIRELGDEIARLRGILLECAQETNEEWIHDKALAAIERPKQPQGPDR